MNLLTRGTRFLAGLMLLCGLGTAAQAIEPGLLQNGSLATGGESQAAAFPSDWEAETVSTHASTASVNYAAASGRCTDCSTSGCASCQLSDCCQDWCGSGPRLSASLGYMFLVTRQDPDNQSLVRLNNSNGPVALDAADISMDEVNGMDLNLSYFLNCDYSLEGRALVFEDQSGQAGVVLPDPTLLLSPPQIFLFTTAGFPALISASYESQFQSYEMNLVRHRCDWNFLCGFRHVEMDESLAINATNIGPMGPLNSFRIGRFATTNDLYGAQLGAEGPLMTFCDGLFSIDFLGKAGVYYNHASSVVGGSFVNTASVTDRDDEVAFLGEIGLYGTVQLTRCLSVRAGYQAMYMDGLALAGRQVSASSQSGVAPVTTNTQTNGALWYGGAVISLIGTY